jgi:hypothetical protein
MSVRDRLERKLEQPEVAPAPRPSRTLTVAAPQNMNTRLVRELREDSQQEEILGKNNSNFATLMGASGGYNTPVRQWTAEKAEAEAVAAPPAKPKTLADTYYEAEMARQSAERAKEAEEIRTGKLIILG